MPRQLEDREMAHHVARDISVGILERMPHPGLGSQMDDLGNVAMSLDHRRDDARRKIIALLLEYAPTRVEVQNFVGYISSSGRASLREAPVCEACRDFKLE